MKIALYKARRDGGQREFPQNSATVPMPKVNPPKEEEPHVYGNTLGHCVYMKAKFL
jgi:hypothetical protein